MTSHTQFRIDLLKIMHRTLWIIPSLMGLIGVSYTLIEHFRHRNEPGWPWLTWIGIIILGFFGPGLSWFILRWAIRSANAYMVSQEQLSHRVEELATLNKLSVAAGHKINLEERLSTILDHTINALDASAGMIFIQEDDETGLRLETHRGISVEMAVKEARLHPGHCLCGQSVKFRKVLFASDVGDDPRCTSNLCICEGFHSVACAPLEFKGVLVGLLQLASPKTNHFTDDQTDFLTATAAQVSVSIENARLYDKVRMFNIELEQKVNQRTKELESTQWALAEKARQLQRLLGESYRIQEDTQARIAHDMHDGVTQTVIGALYETQAARQALFDNPDLAAANLERAQQHLSEVEGEIRRVIYDLHPPILDTMGLVVALKRFASTYSTTFDIDCQILVKGTPQRLPKDNEISIYRIVQAALHNVVAHAQAQIVQVNFDFTPSSLEVAIKDNGNGFEPKATMDAPGDHLGLIGMKERAESLGAKLDVISAPGAGTEIYIHLFSPKYLNQSN